MAVRPTSGTCRVCGERFDINPIGRIREICSKPCTDRLYREKHSDKLIEYHHRYREENSEKVRESQRAWRIANAESLADQKREHYQENIDHYKEYKREYHRKNADRLSAKTVQWQKDNPDKVHMKNQRRRARMREAFVEDVDPRVVLCRDGWVCHICGKDIDPKLKSPDVMSWSIDHVVPLAKGGTHEYKNCKSAHRGCNSRKGAILDYEVYEGATVPEIGG